MPREFSNLDWLSGHIGNRRTLNNVQRQTFSNILSSSVEVSEEEIERKKSVAARRISWLGWAGIGSAGGGVL